MMAKIDWTQAKRWYSLGGESPKSIGKPNKADGLITLPSLEEIANYYGVSDRTVRKYSAKEKWVEIREFQKTERDKKITERLQELQIKSIAEVNAENYKIASSVQAKFLTQLSEGKTTVYAGDAMAWSRLKQEISEKASNIEESDRQHDPNMSIEDQIKLAQDILRRDG